MLFSEIPENDFISETSTKIERDVGSFTTALLSRVCVAEDNLVLRYLIASRLTLLAYDVAVTLQGHGVLSVFRV